MTTEEKNKPVLLEGMQNHTRELFNKGIGSEGVCDTAADVSQKEVTLGTTFKLVEKATVIVTFTNGSTAENATLAVKHTDLAGNETTEEAKPIYYRGQALEAGKIQTGVTLILRYDGSVWNIVGILDQDISSKAEKSETVSDITYDENTGTLKKTINGVTTDVTTVVQSGFVPEYNAETGIMSLNTVGGAKIVPNEETGIIEATF